MDLNIDLSILLIEPADEYRANRTGYLSSSRLLDFIKSPWLYAKKESGLIEDKDSPTCLVDRAAYVRTFKGRDVYEARFAPTGRSVLSPDQICLVEQMTVGVAMNDNAVDLLLYGQAEGVVRANYCGEPCQIRIDWTHPHRGIVSYKTTDDLTLFESDARRHGYHRQMAFYRAVLAEVLGKNVPVHFVAVEKQEPFRCGVWRLGDDTLEIAQRENEAAIHCMQVCHQLDRWPTGYEEVRVLDLV